MGKPEGDVPARDPSSAACLAWAPEICEVGGYCHYRDLIFPNAVKGRFLMALVGVSAQRLYLGGAGFGVGLSPHLSYAGVCSRVDLASRCRGVPGIAGRCTQR